MTGFGARIGDLTEKLGLDDTDDLELSLVGSSGSRRVTGANLKNAVLKKAGEVSVTDPLYGAQGSGTADDSTAIMAAINDAATNGWDVVFPPGRYLVGSATAIVMNPAVKLRFASGAKLLVNGHTITGTLWLADTYNQVFDVTVPASSVACSFHNTILRPEWWGAHSVASEATNDDINALTNRIALLAATACLLDNTSLEFRGMYTVDQAITFPNTSWTLRSGASTKCGLKGKTGISAIRLFDFSGCSGPGKFVIGIQATGPAVGTTRDTGFYCNANGITFLGNWGRGLSTGFDIEGSYVHGVANTCEYCTTGINWGTLSNQVGFECFWDSTLFYANATDVLFSGQSYNGASMGRSQHLLTTGECYRFNGASDVSVAEIIYGDPHSAQTTATVLHLTGGSARIDVKRLKGINAGTVALFENCTDCQLDSLSVEGAAIGLYIVNGTTATNRVLSARIRNCTTEGMRLDGTGANNIVSNFDVSGCAIGLVMATQGVELNDGRISGNTQDTSFPTGLTAIKTRNVQVGTPGDWTPTYPSGKVFYHWTYDSMGVMDTVGTGSPLGVVTAPPGSRYLRLDGTAGKTHYYKESGTDASGWVARNTFTTQVVGTSGTAIAGEQTTLSVAASTPTTIYTFLNGTRPSALLHITGYDASANWFADLVFVADASGTSFTVLSSQNGGSPGTRTYSISGTNVLLSCTVAQSSVRARSAELGAT